VENLAAKHFKTEPLPGIAVAPNPSKLLLRGVLVGFVQDSPRLALQSDSRPFKTDFSVKVRWGCSFPAEDGSHPATA